ncbi:MAG TPA: protein kinase [Terriglobales bacterium]|nr:protein kinase [Terriglobales bacterium]
MSDQPKINSGNAVSLTGSVVGRFAIRERLGTGAMGEVYRAEDTRLNRSVAIKRMADALRADPAQRRRFIKEAERISQLSDPHVAALYDIIEEQGEIFLVMEFVDGCNLRERLSRDTGLRELLSIIMQAAEGLRSAHARNIVHCDIKPENIMITSSGRVKVLDFGLARQLSRADRHVTSVMGSGVGLSGTPGYMAPEVMLEEAPDPRSDIFALGVVFYEALSGSHPFVKRTVFETADSVLHSEPPALHTRGIARPLSDIVARMMAKDVTDRYQSTDELLSDLQAFEQTIDSGIRLPHPALDGAPPNSFRTRKHRGRRVILIAVLVIGVIAAIVPAARHARKIGRALGFSKAPHIAVLPFQSIGGQSSDKAFAEGLSDVITSELAQLSDRYALQIVPAAEVRAERVASAKAARQQFGVDMVIEGSIQPVANMFRATYSVVDASTGRQIRAGTIAVPLGDPIGLQDQLANSIAQNLGVGIKPAERDQVAAHGTTLPAAYNAYLQGLGYLEDYQKKENLDLAIAAFNRALQYDSSYALAYAGLGQAHWHKYREFKETAEISDATLACQRALSIEPDLVEGHRCLGRVFGSTGRYTEAAQQLESALKKRPTDDESVRALASAYEELSDFSRAEATYRRAIDLRPHYWAGYNWLGGYYSSRGQYDKALAMFARVIAIAPENYRGYNNTGGIYILKGDFARAIEQFERSVQIRPSFAGYSNLGTAYFFQKRFGDAVSAYERALKLNDRDYVTWGNLGDAQFFAPGKRASSTASYAEAIRLAEDQLKVNSNDAGALGSISMYYAMLGRRADAERYMRRALALKPGGPDVWWQASVVYSQLGRPDDTLSALQSALAAGLSSSYISSAAYFEKLHSDPRFQQLIRSANKLERR